MWDGLDAPRLDPFSTAARMLRQIQDPPLLARVWLSFGAMLTIREHLRILSRRVRIAMGILFQKSPRRYSFNERVMQSEAGL